MRLVPPPAYLTRPCPTCGAATGDRCRTMRTRRVTDTHAARLVAPVPHGNRPDATPRENRPDRTLER